MLFLAQQTLQGQTPAPAPPRPVPSETQALAAISFQAAPALLEAVPALHLPLDPTRLSSGLTSQCLGTIRFDLSLALSGHWFHLRGLGGRMSLEEEGEQSCIA